MNMRRYGMGSPRVHRLKRLLRRDSINVKKIVVAAHDKREDSVYVFYTHVKEEERKDKASLERLKQKAIEVAEDKVYQKLSNSKQKELFLLDHYNLSKKESGDVIELAKIAEVEALVAQQEIAKEEPKDMIKGKSVKKDKKVEGK